MSNRLFGIIIVILGVLFLLNSLEVIEINLWRIIFTWWPAILFIIGFDQVFQGMRKSRFGDLLSGILLLLLGSALLGKNLGYFQLDFRLLGKILFPVLLILIGINLLSGRRVNGKTNWAIMGGIDKGKSAWDLKSGSYGALMGGIELDLRKANISEGETILDLTAIMGGIEITVPPQLQVKGKALAILGGIDIKGEGGGGIIYSKNIESDTSIEATSYLTIQARAIMGGIEVKS